MEMEMKKYFLNIFLAKIRDDVVLSLYIFSKWQLKF